MAPVSLLSFSLLITVVRSQPNSCSNAQDFGVVYSGETVFSVGQNGTCSCPRYAGNGTLITGLDSNPYVRLLESRVASLENTVAQLAAIVNQKVRVCPGGTYMAGYNVTLEPICANAPVSTTSTGTTSTGTTSTGTTSTGTTSTGTTSTGSTSTGTTSTGTTGVQTYTLQPGPGQSKDIWTTSMYAYAPGGGGPGGGMDNEELRCGGWGDTYQSLLQFDLSTLPYRAISATVMLYNRPNAGTPTQLYLDRITQFWDWRTQGTGRDRDRLWWADKPPATQLAQLPEPQLGAWYSIDITSLYNSWKDGTVPNYGIQLRPVSTSNTYAMFHSSEYMVDPLLRPKLVVVG